MLQALVDSTVQWMLDNQGKLLDQTIQHLNVSLTALFLALVLWIPIGLLIHYDDRAAQSVLGVAGVVLTIPSLALLPLMIPLLGIGVAPAVTALTLYSALPMIRNTYTGLEDLNPAMIRAGRGLGMTERQLLLQVKLPLAMPVIFAGIRQAAVLVVGITTIAAIFGAGGLGSSIFTGIALNFPEQILGATILVSLIAIALDYALATAQRLLPGGAPSGAGGGGA